MKAGESMKSCMFSIGGVCFLIFFFKQMNIKYLSGIDHALYLDLIIAQPYANCCILLFFAAS